MGKITEKHQSMYFSYWVAELLTESYFKSLEKIMYRNGKDYLYSFFFIADLCKKKIYIY